MPLDAECAGIVAAIESTGVQWSDGIDPDEATKGWGAGLLLGAGGEAETVASVQDLDALGVQVRVYRPDAAQPLPLILFLHGGGFTIGSIDSHDPVTRRLANRVPAIIVSVGYRKGPEHRFPAAQDDAWTALRWVGVNAAQLGADGSRLAVAGDSAGASLATYLAIRARDEGGPPLRLQVLWLPWVDCALETAASGQEHISFQEFADGFVLDADAMRWFRESYVDEADYSDWRVSPARSDDLSRLAPAFVATAECDPLRDQGEEYAGRLRAAGVPVGGGRYEGTYHPFYGMTAILAAARRLEDDTVAALQGALS